METLRKFREESTEEEQTELATRLETTKNYLFQHAGQHRKVSIKKAAQIEQVTREMFLKNGGRTPVVYRTELSAVCCACPFAREALGNDVCDAHAANNADK